MMKTLAPQQAQGELVIKTIAMPDNANVYGDIFGGWLMSQMDLGSGIIAKKWARGKVVTACVENMNFFSPVHIGESVSCYAYCKKTGKSSLQINIQLWTELLTTAEKKITCAAQATFYFVAVDKETGKSRPLPIENQYYICNHE